MDGAGVGVAGLEVGRLRPRQAAGTRKAMVFPKTSAALSLLI
jgi:hypothetical protein